MKLHLVFSKNHNDGRQWLLRLAATGKTNDLAARRRNHFPQCIRQNQFYGTLAIAIATLTALPCAFAQNTVPEPETDSLMENAARILSGKSGKLNEVTVVLPPPESESAAASDGGAPAEEAENADVDAKEPLDPETDTSADDPQDEVLAALQQAPEEAPQDPEPGLAVRVERLQAGTGVIDPAQVKLLAPFPAKLLARTPGGWRIEASEHAPPFTREVELSPGKNITLSIRPHLLVAEADGVGVFDVHEPGFDATRGYHQDVTVGAILSSSIRQLEHDSKQLGTAIEQLQQLLVSLPQAPPEKEPAVQPVNKPKR